MKIVLAFLLLCSGWARADCVSDSAARYHVNEDVLWAIGWIESRHKPGAIGIPLPDGNVALGRFQINTIHLPRLAQYGLTKKDLFDGCKSAFLGGWVLAGCIRDKGPVWAAVGCYVAGPKSKNVKAQQIYISQVQSAYERRIAARRAAYGQASPPQLQLASAAPAKPLTRMAVWSSDE